MPCDLSGRLAEKREYAGCALTSTQLSSSVRYTYSGTTGQLTDTAYTSSLGDVSMNYAYGDASGQRRDMVHRVQQDNMTYVAYTYDELGRRVSRSPGDCTTQQYTYVDDPDAPALTSTRVASVTGYYGTSEYSYDANGNITRIQNGSETQDFTYDALGQLIAYTDAGGNAYAYTYQNGNILTATKNSETYHTYAYADTGWSDLLTAFDGGAITYDNIGNPLTYHDGKTFTWTAGRRLSGVTDGESSYTYAYDGDGNRISKTVNGVTTEFVYVDGKLLGLQKGQDKLQFLYDETDTAYGFLHNGTPYYYDKNLQGDISGIYDRNGSRVATYTYDVWGLPEFISDNALATLNPLRYRGYFYDDETGFYYLQSRYYDPEVGRFINSDRYVSTGQGVLGYNLFAYCLNNPIRFLDDSGSRCVEGDHRSGWVMVTNSGRVVQGGPPTSDVGAAQPYVDMPGGDRKSPNCYSYAIGSSVNEQPGGASGRVPKRKNDVNDVGESVKADLVAKGYTVRRISGPDAKVYDNEFKIALRVGTQPCGYLLRYPMYDYHFMRQTNTGQWAEKHGTGGASILWDEGMTPDTIPWTLYGKPYYDSAIIYYAVGS